MVEVTAEAAQALAAEASAPDVQISEDAVELHWREWVLRVEMPDVVVPGTAKRLVFKLGKV